MKNRFRIHLFWATVVAVPTFALSQVPDSSAWKHNAIGTLNVSQGYFDNWTKGGVDALSWEIRLEGNLVQDQKNFTWETKGKGVYGQIKVGSLSTRKSSDELVLETIYTRKMNAWVNPFASLRGQSQFSPSYSYDDSAQTRAKIANSFDPTYLVQTLGLGFDWKKRLQIRLGGATKETFSSKRFAFADDKETVDEIETSKFEPGASFSASYNQVLMENLLINSNLEVFANFKGWEETDGRWENRVSAKVNKYISTNLGFEMLYDFDLSDSSQMRESLSIAISFLAL